MDELGKSRRLRWKDSLLIGKIAKLESGLLKTREDMARPSSKSRNFTDACVPHLGTRGFSRVRRKFSVLAEGRHIFGRRPKPRAETALEKSLTPREIWARNGHLHKSVLYGKLRTAKSLTLRTTKEETHQKTASHACRRPK